MVGRLVSKEIENVAQGGAIGLEKLGVSTLATNHGCKPLSLNIENLAPEPASGSDFADFVLVPPTFWALIVQMFHIITPFCLFIID